MTDQPSQETFQKIQDAAIQFQNAIELMTGKKCVIAWHVGGNGNPGAQGSYSSANTSDHEYRIMVMSLIHFLTCEEDEPER